MKKILFSAAAIIIIMISSIAVYYIVSDYDETINTASSASSYKECVEEGGEIQESYPSICVTLDGESFTQDIGNEMEKRDLIRIANPRPAETIMSPIEIKGEAVGSWFFEATFPVKLHDAQGNIIAEGVAQSGANWMTTDFVPFTAILEFEPQGQGGTLVLEKSNPSGLAHNADKLEIPVYFENPQK